MRLCLAISSRYGQTVSFYRNTHFTEFIVYHFVDVDIVLLREAPHKDDACSNGILPNSVSTPPPLKQTDALWQVFFAEN